MPPSRLPAVSDFPRSLNPIIHPSSASPSSSHSIPPSPTQPPNPSNVILFLPGLGDTSPNFSTFPRALNLPDTLNITLQPAFPFPFGLTDTTTYHWSDDLSISTTGSGGGGGGELDVTESGLERATALVAQTVIVDVLMARCGFRGEEIHLFGSGQGGSLALSVPLHVSLRGMVLGGVISVGGPLPLRTPGAAAKEAKNGTPVLVVGGKRGEVFGGGGGAGGDGGAGRVKRIRDRYRSVEVEAWKKVDDGMPKNRDEVLPLMRFWGRRLRSRRGVPDGAVEVG